MNELLVIYGAGGHGKVVLDAALLSGWQVDCVVDDAPAEKWLLGCRVLNAASVDWSREPRRRFVVAVGENAVRARLFHLLEQQGARAATVRHPGGVVSPKCALGGGVFLAAGAVVNVGAVVGDNVIVNTCASVDHDCAIGAHVHICPGVRLAGNVRVGDGAMIGTGACVLPGVRVGAYCVIGAGAVVVRDDADFSLAVGVPARVIKRLSEAEPGHC